MHPKNEHGNLLLTHLTGRLVKVPSENLCDKTVVPSNRKLSETHPILGGSELDNVVTPGTLVVRGKNGTAISMTEYFVAPSSAKLVVVNKKERKPTLALINGATDTNVVKKSVVIDTGSALVTSANNEIGAA